MQDVTVRIHFRQPDGAIEDGQQDFGLESFAGFLPAVGDTIVDPGVRVGLDRRDPANREVWTVVQRVFGPRDLQDCVVLVVEARKGTEADTWI